jgi:hypothetical protein
MGWAPVPKAPVHKNSKMAGAEDKIWLTAFDPGVYSIPVSSSPKQSPNRQFWDSIASADPGHDLRSFLCAKDVSHLESPNVRKSDKKATASRNRADGNHILL